MRRSPAPGKLRQEDHHEFKASLHFVARPSLKSLQSEIPELRVTAYSCLDVGRELGRVPQNEAQPWEAEAGRFL